MNNFLYNELNILVSTYLYECNFTQSAHLFCLESNTGYSGRVPYAALITLIESALETIAREIQSDTGSAPRNLGLIDAVYHIRTRIYRNNEQYQPRNTNAEVDAVAPGVSNPSQNQQNEANVTEGTSTSDENCLIDVEAVSDSMTGELNYVTEDNVVNVERNKGLSDPSTHQQNEANVTENTDTGDENYLDVEAVSDSTTGDLNNNQIEVSVTEDNVVDVERNQSLSNPEGNVTENTEILSDSDATDELNYKENEVSVAEDNVVNVDDVPSDPSASQQNESNVTEDTDTIEEDNAVTSRRLKKLREQNRARRCNKKALKRLAKITFKIKGRKKVQARKERRN